LVSDEVPILPLVLPDPVPVVDEFSLLLFDEKEEVSSLLEEDDELEDEFDE